MNTITINGKRMNFSGGNVSVINGKVIVDGKNVDVPDAPVFNIVVEGNVGEVSGDFATVTVAGDAGSVKTMSGDAKVDGNVNGSVSTMSGDVRVKGSIGGSVSTMSGDIN